MLPYLIWLKDIHSKIKECFCSRSWRWKRQSEKVNIKNFLKSFLREISGIFDDIIRAERDSEKWKVLILDVLTTRLLSSITKMSEITAEKIVLIEDIRKNRRPMADLEAIYFISPTTESVRRLIDDFSPGSRPYLCKNRVIKSNLWVMCD